LRSDFASVIGKLRRPEEVIPAWDGMDGANQEFNADL